MEYFISRFYFLIEHMYLEYTLTLIESKMKIFFFFILCVLFCFLILSLYAIYFDIIHI